MVGRLLVSPTELFGDGVFETVHLRPDGPWLLEQHLARLARSAELLDIPVPPSLPDRIAAALAETDFPDSPGEEKALRIMLTRESPHVTVSPIPESTLRERRSGIRVISASTGCGLGQRPPWSLAGAKSLSYGSHFAARRWARQQGADDLLFRSLEGYALEAPTASLVWLANDQLCTVPAVEADILPGTTVHELLSSAASAGLGSCQRMITIDELRDASAMWFASSLRGLAEVVSLDGVSRPRSPWTPRLLDLLGFQAG